MKQLKTSFFILCAFLSVNANAFTLSEAENSIGGCSDEEMKKLCEDHSDQLDKCGVSIKSEDREKYCLDNFEPHQMGAKQTLIPKGSTIPKDFALPGDIAICNPIVIGPGVKITGKEIVLKESVKLLGSTELNGNNILLKATTVKNTFVGNNVNIAGATNKSFDAIVDVNDSKLGDDSFIDGENSKVTISNSDFKRKTKIISMYSKDKDKNKIVLDGVKTNDQSVDPLNVVTIKGSNINLSKSKNGDFDMFGSILNAPGMKNYEKGVKIEASGDISVAVGTVLAGGKYSKSFKGTTNTNRQSNPELSDKMIRLEVPFGQSQQGYTLTESFNGKIDGKYYQQMSKDEKVSYLQQLNSEESVNRSLGGKHNSDLQAQNLSKGRQQVLSWYGQIDNLSMSKDEVKAAKSKTLQILEASYGVYTDKVGNLAQYPGGQVMEFHGEPTLMYMGSDEDDVEFSGYHITADPKGKKKVINLTN